MTGTDEALTLLRLCTSSESQFVQITWSQRSGISACTRVLHFVVFCTQSDTPLVRHALYKECRTFVVHSKRARFYNRPVHVFRAVFFFFFRNTRDIWHCTCLGGEKNRVVIRYATFRAPTLVRLHWLDPLCEAPHTEIYIYVYIYMKLLHATSMRGKKKEGDKLTCALGVAVWLARRS